MKSRVLFSSLLAAMCMSVFATGHPNKPDKHVDPVQKPFSEQHQYQYQSQDANAKAFSKANSDASATSANGDQATIVDASSHYAAQVPALIMGTVIPVDCGFGGQAGGANTHSAGFLGLTWTTDRCYTLKVANSWAAMGQYEYACEMLMDVSRKALKRRNIESVNCIAIGLQLREQHTVVTTVTEPTPVVTSSYVTRDQMQEYVDRAFRKSVRK